MVTKYLSVFLQWFASELTRWDDLSQFPSNLPRGSLTFNSSREPSYAVTKPLEGYTHEPEGTARRLPVVTRHCPPQNSGINPLKARRITPTPALA